MRKTLLIALCFFCMNVLAVNEKVPVWKASASGSSGSEHVKGLKMRMAKMAPMRSKALMVISILIRVSILRGAGTAT